MNLMDVTENLLSLYRELAKEFADGQHRSGLECLPGCGQCCLSPNVEATLVEMLPMAVKLVREGRGEMVLNELTESPSPSCWAYQRRSADGSKGQCGEYETRPTICREFGVAATKDKLGNPRLSICKLIRAENPQKSQAAEESVAQWAPPLMEEWTIRLLQIHPGILSGAMPINHALARALEMVLLRQGLQEEEAADN